MLSRHFLALQCLEIRIKHWGCSFKMDLSQNCLDHYLIQIFPKFWILRSDYLKTHTVFSMFRLSTWACQVGPMDQGSHKHKLPHLKGKPIEFLFWKGCLDLSIFVWDPLCNLPPGNWKQKSLIASIQAWRDNSETKGSLQIQWILISGKELKCRGQKLNCRGQSLIKPQKTQNKTLIARVKA